MTDKNGIEIKTGMVVRISGAYFKKDNGLYYVDSSPGDPSWCGKDHCLRKITRKGEISKTNDICFWPLITFVNDREKTIAAKVWNRENAQIEVVRIDNTRHIKAKFEEKSENMWIRIQRGIWDWGEDSDAVKRDRAIMEHYNNVAASL